MNIRIVPMSMNEDIFIGKSIVEIQEEFFMDYLINEEKNWYGFAKSGLNASEGDLLLFQFDNKVIASAILDSVIRYKKETEYGANGAYVLKKGSIKVFKPIERDELKIYIPGFEAFNQAKQQFKIEDITSLNERMMLK